MAGNELLTNTTSIKSVFLASVAPRGQPRALDLDQVGKMMANHRVATHLHTQAFFFRSTLGVNETKLFFYWLTASPPTRR